MDGLVFGLLAIVLFVVVLGGIVLVHELGHYLTAKALNVRVLEFGIGFPPRARVLRSKGETLWTLNWLPIGGFVRLEGEDGESADDPRSFAAKSLRARLAILVAGVAMNIALTVKITVAGKRSKILSMTGRLELNDLPRSPVAAFFINTK